MSAAPVGDYLRKRYPPDASATHALGDDRNPLGCMEWHAPCLYHAAFREGAASAAGRIAGLEAVIDEMDAFCARNFVIPGDPRQARWRAIRHAGSAALAAADELSELGQEIQGDTP